MDGLSSNARLVELLQPWHTRTCGAWILGMELLLAQLPPKDLEASMQMVCSLCLLERTRADPCLLARLAWLL